MYMYMSNKTKYANVKDDFTSNAPDLSEGIIAVDNGGDNIKVLSETMESPISFKSAKAKGSVEDTRGVIPLPEHFHSYVVEWNGEVYLTNERIAESKFKPMSGFRDSKSHEFFILSTLVAVAKYGYDINHLSTSVPYEHYRKAEVNAIKERLLGDHSISIDGEPYKFKIANVLVEVEAQAAHYYLKKEGIHTILEIGSRTIGYATNKLVRDENGKIAIDFPIREKTGTLDRQGIQISKLSDSEYGNYTEGIYNELSHLFPSDHPITVIGGGVLIDKIRAGLEDEYSNIEFDEDPLFIQVKGMLALAKMKLAKRSEG